MEELSLEDKELIALAKEAIEKNYDGKEFLQTVGAALRCQDGKVFVGVNVYSLHGTCAEQVALGCAITAGERKFETIVAVEGKTGKILSPCGNCRQVLSDYMPEAYVIVSQDGKIGKIKAKELLPLAYHVSC